MKIKFTEEPLAWIGVRTWPFWTMTYKEARTHGKLVVFFLLPFAAVTLWGISR